VRCVVASCAGMLYEGVYSEDFQGHYLMVVLGMFLGYIFIAVCEATLDDKEYSLGELSGANAKRAMLVLLIMTMHSFAEGLGVGVSWAGARGDVKGQFVTAAIGVHNIPEGMTRDRFILCHSATGSICRNRFVSALSLQLCLRMLVYCARSHISLTKCIAAVYLSWYDAHVTNNRT
jgi:hypothetical protein